MPALVVMAEVADSRTDGFLAVVTLSHRLYTLVAVKVSTHQEVALLAKILAASLANEALLVPALALIGDLLGAESDNLSTLLAFICVLVEAPFADDSLLDHAIWLVVD